MTKTTSAAPPTPEELIYESEIYTTKEAAAIFGVTHDTIKKNVARGNLTTRVKGGTAIIPGGELLRYAKARRRGGRPPGAKNKPKEATAPPDVAGDDL